MEKCNQVSSPIVPGCKLVKNENEEGTDATLYKQMVGCLMYLLATRPDLGYSVCLVARFMDRPTEIHVTAVKRIMRYLKGTLSFGIVYKSNSKTSMKLKGWCDSDYAGDLNDRKSTTSYVFMLGSGAISWSSKKQPIVTLSTTEAKYVSTAACVYQGVWLKNVLSYLKMKQVECIKIYCDNSSSIKLSKNPIMHGRCKHIDVRFQFLRDLTKDGTVELVHCRSEDQLADLLIKPLKLESFCKLREGLGICD
ncbi:type I inositol 145-trisphosphate 5-phosphatase 12-like protein, partial [Trifolium pratense]